MSKGNPHARSSCSSSSTRLASPRRARAAFRGSISISSSSSSRAGSVRGGVVLIFLAVRIRCRRVTNPDNCGVGFGFLNRTEVRLRAYIIKRPRPPDVPRHNPSRHAHDPISLFAANCYSIPSTACTDRRESRPPEPRPSRSCPGDGR